jgi:hypothetical protein
LADTQSAPRPRELTIEEAHSILKAWIPDASQWLPGCGLEDFTVHDPQRFYFIAVIWDNPRGSVVWGNCAVGRATGNLWTGVICERVTSRRVRAAQAAGAERTWPD